MNLDEALTYARDVGRSERDIVAAIKADADQARFRRDKGLVTLTHPETGGEFDAHPDTVEQWQKAGWVRKDADRPSNYTQTGHGVPDRGFALKPESEEK